MYKKIYLDILQDDLKSKFSNLNDHQVKELSTSIINNIKSKELLNFTEEQINDIDKSVKIYKKSYLKNYLLKLYGFQGGDLNVEQTEANTFVVIYSPTTYKKDTYIREIKI